MRILAGGPARETDSALYRLHKRCLIKQHAEVVHHIVVEDTGGPKWHAEKIERVARARQDMLDWAKASYDALLMVDTDVILGPSIVERMAEVDADVVYGVFWSRWTGFTGPMPQVWDEYPYGLSRGLQQALLQGLEFTDSRFGFEMDSGTVKEVPVLGGGACTLIRGRALDCRYSPLLENLVTHSDGDMWCGEDRSYGVRLMASGITQIALTGQPIVHLDTAQKQSEEALTEAEMMVGW